MKIFTGKKLWQKMIIALITIILLFQFTMTAKSYAIFELDDLKDFAKEIGEKILWGVVRAPSALGDVTMGLLNNFMLGTDGFGTAMLSQEALGKGSWFDAENISDGGEDGTNIAVEQIEGEDGENKIVVYVDEDYLDEKPAWRNSDGWEIPNLLYCPENIFGNNIAMLDVNFLNPNTYTSVVETTKGEDKSKSIGASLKETISSWYKAFRNIAIVILLSVLVYLGIRILISSTAEDKAKYKETIKDWAIALCLIFAMHFIMSAIIMIVNEVNGLFVGVNNSIYVHVNGANITFKSNFTGVMRFLAQSGKIGDTLAYSVIYWTLIFYTLSFTIQYLKRVLYIAFYTMISPLVAITYPIDKLGDGKSQAFNKWFKEYVMTMALQPIHLIIYTMIVSSSFLLSIKNPLFAIIAIGFLIPAEQFIKGLFGVESKADGFKGFTSGVLASKALDMLKKPVAPPKSGNGGGSEGGDSNDENPVIRQSSSKPLDAFKGNGGNTGETPALGNGNVDGGEGGDTPRLNPATNPQSDTSDGEQGTDENTSNPFDGWGNGGNAGDVSYGYAGTARIR